MEENSFRKNNANEIKLIGELLTGRQGDRYTLGESGLCAFSADGSKFAWSCGSRKVVVIPWQIYKNLLYSKENLQSTDHQFVTERIAIDAGFPVSSLTFCTGIPAGGPTHSKKEYWRRFDPCQDLTLATGHINGRIRIWDPYTGKLQLELSDHRAAIHCLSFALDGSLRLVSGSQDGAIKVWDLSDDGNMFKTLCSDKTSPVRAVSWAPNGKYLCSVGLMQKAIIWNMERYTLHMRLVGHMNDVIACDFSPDGALVATASRDSRIIVWNTATGKVTRVLNHATPPPSLIYMSGSNDFGVRGVSFSNTGLELASSCMDGSLRVWDLTRHNDAPVRITSGPSDDPMHQCMYTPGGGAIVLGFSSGNLLLYTYSARKVPSLLHLARMAVRRKSRQENTLIPATLCGYLKYRDW